MGRYSAGQRCTSRVVRCRATERFSLLRGSSCVSRNCVNTVSADSCTALRVAALKEKNQKGR